MENTNPIAEGSGALPDNDWTTVPSTSAAPAPSLPPPEKRLWLMVAAMFVIAMSSVSSFAVASFMNHDMLAKLYTQREAQFEAQSRALLAEQKKQNEEMLKALQDIQASPPPNNDKLFTILSKGVTLTEDIINVVSTTTTPTALFADLTTTQQTESFTQEALVQNLDTTNDMCVKGIAWSTAGATGALKCASVTITCNGSVTDGVHVGAKATFPLRKDGTELLCGVSATGTVKVVDVRLVR